MEKKCRLCKQVKLIEKFSRINKYSEERVSACTICRNNRKIENYSPEDLENYKLKQKLNVTKWRGKIKSLPDNDIKKISIIGRERKSNLKFYYKNREKLNKKHKEYSKEWYVKNKERELKNSRKRYMEAKIKNPFRNNYSNYCSRERKRGSVFPMSFDEFKKYVEQRCFYCGNISGGIDRIDNLLGYVKGNITPCCKTCNYMKNKTSQKDFIYNCRRIAKLHENWIN